MDQIVFKKHSFLLSDLRRVAELHRSEIKTGFLASLGVNFLTLLYRTIAQSCRSILVVAFNNGQIIGFASGAISKRAIFSRLLRNNMLILSFILLPKFFSSSNIAKIIDLLIYSGASGERNEVPSAELLSMVVEERFRGRGVAQKLFTELVNEFRKMGIETFKIVVGDSLIPAQRFYEKMGARRSHKIELHKGVISWVYIFNSGPMMGVFGKADYVRRYSELFKQKQTKSIILDGILWKVYQKMVVPVGPVSIDYTKSLVECRDHLLRYFKESVLIRAGAGFIEKPTSWYAVVCDQTFDLADFSSSTRSKIRRGLKNCLVSRIDVRFMLEHAWPVFSSAFRRYNNDKLRVSKARFKQNIAITAEFGDIVHYWGVFERRTGKLIAYTKNYIYDKIEVNYWDIKFHPDFLHFYPSYALFYEMNRYYLQESKFRYVNDGFRNLLHDTNIQEYLERKFKFKKQPVGLRIEYQPFVGQCMSLTYPFRYLLGKLYQPLAALYKLEEINRNE